MKNFFEAIASLFENLLFLPYQLPPNSNLAGGWPMEGALAIGPVAAIYWIKQLRKFTVRGKQRPLCSFIFIDQTRYLF